MAFATNFGHFPASSTETNIVPVSSHMTVGDSSGHGNHQQPICVDAPHLPQPDGRNRWPQLPAPEYPPARQDWENYRIIFTELYQVQDRPLKEVKELLEQRYGFRATDRMYKKRIREWKVMKNYKREEKDAVYRALQDRRLAGKDHHHILIRNQPAKVHRILRHIQNSGARINARLLGPPLPTEDNEIEVRTPENESTPDNHAVLWNSALESLQQLNATPSPHRPILTHDDIGKAEVVCLEIVKYFDTWTPFTTSAGPILGSTKRKHPSNCIQDIDIASFLAEAERYADARIVLSEAFDKLTHVLKQQSPHLLPALIDAGFNLVNRSAYFRVRDIFFKHATGLCEILLGVQHPITAILRTLRSMGLNLHVLNTVFECLLEVALTKTKASDDDGLCEYIRWRKAFALTEVGNLREAELVLQPAKSIDVSFYRTDCHLTLEVQLSLARLYADSQQNYSEAKALFENMLRGFENQDKPLPLCIKYTVFELFGVIACGESEFEQAKQFFHRALHLLMRSKGSADVQMICAICYQIMLIILANLYRSAAQCHGNQLLYLVRGPYQNLLHPT